MLEKYILPKREQSLRKRKKNLGSDKNTGNGKNINSKRKKSRKREKYREKSAAFRFQMVFFLLLGFFLFRPGFFFPLPVFFRFRKKYFFRFRKVLFFCTEFFFPLPIFKSWHFQEQFRNAHKKVFSMRRSICCVRNPSIANQTNWLLQRWWVCALRKDMKIAREYQFAGWLIQCFLRVALFHGPQGISH